MKEKLQEYALLAEVISALAIVVSLVFVGFQIQQGNQETALNTKAIQSTVQQSMLETDLAGLYIYVDHPYLTNRKDIPPEKVVEIKAIIIAFLRMREYYWQQHQQGLLDEATWLSYREPLTQVVFQSEIGREVWAMGGFNPAFRAEIDNWIGSLSLSDIDDVIDLKPRAR
jgi:hypothetical protein